MIESRQPPQLTPYGGTRRILLYGLSFLAIDVALHDLYQLTSGTVIQRELISQITMRPAAALIQLLFPADHVTLNGTMLQWPGGEANAGAGCDGAACMFLMLGAILPFPSSWPSRLRACALGVLLIYVLNQIRLVILYDLLRRYPAGFSLAHHAIAPILIMTCASLFFLAWTAQAARNFQSGPKPLPAVFARSTALPRTGQEKT
jgi:exosortase family protein XrtM